MSNTRPNKVDAIWTPRGARYHVTASGLDIFIISTLVTDHDHKVNRAFTLVNFLLSRVGITIFHEMNLSQHFALAVNKKPQYYKYLSFTEHRKGEKHKHRSPKSLRSRQHHKLGFYSPQHRLIKQKTSLNLATR